jgi:hypothetical protein
MKLGEDSQNAISVGAASGGVDCRIELLGLEDFREARKQIGFKSLRIVLA